MNIPVYSEKKNLTLKREMTKGLNLIIRKSAYSAPINNFACYMLRHEHYGCVSYKKLIYNLDDEFDRVRLLLLLVFDGIIKVVSASSNASLLYTFQFEFVHPEFTYMNLDVSRNSSWRDRRNNMQDTAILYNLYGTLLIPLSQADYETTTPLKGDNSCSTD